jgi:hypothetical protein
MYRAGIGSMPACERDATGEGRSVTPARTFSLARGDVSADAGLYGSTWNLAS